MAKRGSDGKASREMGETQEETESLEDKAVKPSPKTLEMKTTNEKVSKEQQRSKRSKRSKREQKPARKTPAMGQKKGAVFRKPSQEITENQSMKSGKQEQKNASKPGNKKPSTEKTELESKKSARVKKPSAAKAGGEVTPTGMSGKETKDQETEQTAALLGTTWRVALKQGVLNKEYQGCEEQFVRLPCFHGFICREDLNMLLKKPGDWLIRVSVQPNEPKEKKKDDEAKAGEKGQKTRDKHQKVAVVSVYGKDKEKVVSPAPPAKPNPPPIRHLLIRNLDGKVQIEQGKPFKNFTELITFYQKNTGTDAGADFQLLFPVPLSPWEIQHEDVELLEKKLGEGAFGDVRVGRLKSKEAKKAVTEVAVKMLKNPEKEAVSREQVAELLHEARVMRMLDHVNVLRTFGIAVLKEPLYLMSELCVCGALREYLKENQKTVTLKDKLNFVLGSARGVEYLHSQKLIHRDLAVRNILLTDDKTPKVSDFGLAKQTERYEMREPCKIPVRYLAPETLELFIFTTKTDVFSFGCVIWEIYKNGQQPHDGKNAQTIREQSKRHEFLKLSSTAPEELRRLVTERVFVADPENRCSMTAIVQCAEKLMKK